MRQMAVVLGLTWALGVAGAGCGDPAEEACTKIYNECYKAIYDWNGGWAWRWDQWGRAECVAANWWGDNVGQLPDIYADCIVLASCDELADCRLPTHFRVEAPDRAHLIPVPR